MSGEVAAPKADPAPDFRIEAHARAEGFWPVAGVDEAGRGPLAGPVVAAAVILDTKAIPAGIDDSKRLTPAIRERLFAEILATSAAVAVASVCAASIDASDIRKASLEAMRRAVAALAVRPMLVVADGRDVPPGLGCAARAVVGGDRLSLSIAAASIVAKHARDTMLTRCARQHGHYGFDGHKGYGTAAHLAALRTHGPVARLHRLTFAPLRA